MQHQQIMALDVGDQPIFSQSILPFKRHTPNVSVNAVAVNAVSIGAELPTRARSSLKPTTVPCRHQLYPTSHHCLSCGKSYLEIKWQGERFEVEYGRRKDQEAADSSAGECSVPFPVASGLMLGIGSGALLVVGMMLTLGMVYWLVA
jgi:hypothetical protein